MKLRNLWKIYFFISLITLLVSPFYYVLEPSTFKIKDAIDYIVWSIGLLGLFGFAYQRRTINVLFWKVWFFILVVWDTSFTINSFFEEPVKFDGLSIFIAAMIFIVLILPQYFAIYLFGFKSAQIWNRNQ